MSPVYSMRPLRYRAIWISDVHLGSRSCKAEFLLDFLKSTESEYLYLVGDIIDLWNMRRGLYWPQTHNNVIRTILGKAKQGVKVVYIPGNHDELVRDYDRMLFGNVSIRLEDIHTTADGRKLLVIHGDEFDSVVKCSRLVSSIGGYAYDWLVSVNRLVNHFRRKIGFPYWSFAAYLKTRMKNAVNYISSFEQAISHEAHKRKVDGLVCGHIHHAEIKHLNGALYCNDGDWVESCTALVETQEGCLRLLHWGDEKHTVKSVQAVALDANARTA